MATSTTNRPISTKDIARARMFGIRLPKPAPAPASPPAPKPATGSCSLVLKINGQRYSVRPLPADFGGMKAFRLTRPDGEFHDVSRDVYGPGCTCGDFVWRRDGIDEAGCKHVRACRALGLLD